MLKFKKQERFTQQTNRFVLIVSLCAFFLGIWSIIDPSIINGPTVYSLIFTGCFFFSGCLFLYLVLTNDPIVKKEEIITSIEFTTHSWKSKLSDLFMGLTCFIVLPFFIFDGDMTLVQKLIFGPSFLGFGILWTYLYFRDLLRTEFKPHSKEERMAEIKKDLLNEIKRYYIRPKIEGSEEDLKMNMKTVLTELASEC